MQCEFLSDVHVSRACHSDTMTYVHLAKLREQLWYFRNEQREFHNLDIFSAERVQRTEPMPVVTSGLGMVNGRRTKVRMVSLQPSLTELCPWCSDLSSLNVSTA